MKNQQGVNWYKKQLRKDKVELERHKGNLINKIKNQGKESISNTIHEETKKGMIWRIKKILGIN